MLNSKHSLRCQQCQNMALSSCLVSFPVPCNNRPVSFESKSHLPVCIFADSVVIDTSFVPQWDGHLTRAALTFPHQETAVDSGAQQVFSCVARHRTVVPGELVETVHRRDVVAGHPTEFTRLVAHLSPFICFVVAQNSHLITWKRMKAFYTCIQQVRSTGQTRDLVTKAKCFAAAVTQQDGGGGHPWGMLRSQRGVTSMEGDKSEGGDVHGGWISQRRGKIGPNTTCAFFKGSEVKCI